MTEDELRLLELWVQEQVAIAEGREAAKAVLDGDPEARRQLEAAWAPVSNTDPNL